MTVTNGCGIQTSSFDTTGNWSFFGTNFDVTATGIGQVDAPALNLGISLATVMNMGNVSCALSGTFTSMQFTTTALLTSEFLVVAPSLPGGDGGLTGNAIAIAQATANPTSSMPSGYGFLYVGASDGNLYFGNSTSNAYQLTPPGGGGAGWLLGGNATSSTQFLGTTTLQEIQIGTSSQPVLTITSSQQFVISGSVGSIIPGTSLFLDSPIISIGTITGNVPAITIGFYVTTGNAATVSIEGSSVTMDAVTGTLFGTHATSLAIGNSSTAWTLSGTNVSSSFSGVVTLQSSDELITTCVNGGNAATVDLFNDGSATITATSSVNIDGLNANIQTFNTNATTISHPSGLGTLVLNSTAITIPNIATAPGGQKVLMIDPTTFQIYISP